MPTTEKELLDSRAPYRQTTLRQRLRETQWSEKWGWNLFTMSMGSGAVMVTINSIPYKFHGQFALSTIFFIIDILLFILNCEMTLIRAVRHPEVFKNSFYDQTEAPWLPTFNLSMATLLIGMIDLGIPRTGPWFIVTVEVLFYIYLFLGAMTGLLLQNTWRRLPRPLHSVGPVECLEAFPLMLGGSIGGLLCSQLEPIRPGAALTVLIFSVICQGLGFFISLLKLSAWMLHHIVLPRAPAKTLPAYIIAAGPPGFTALALVNIGQASLQIFPSNNFLSGEGIDPNVAAQIFAVVGIWFALLMTGMFFWLAYIDIGWGLLNAVTMVKKGYLGSYELSWWAWTFPLAGMISCWAQFATYFPSKVFGVLNIIGTIFVFCFWVFNMVGSFTLLYNGILPGIAKSFDPRAVDAETSATEDLEPIRHRSRDDNLGSRDHAYGRRRLEAETAGTGEPHRI